MNLGSKLDKLGSGARWDTVWFYAKIPGTIRNLWQIITWDTTSGISFVFIGCFAFLFREVCELD